MQRIADDFAAINARLSEISAEKAKAGGDEPKQSPAHELPSPYYVQSVNSVYQAPDDYCGFKPIHVIGEVNLGGLVYSSIDWADVEIKFYPGADAG